MNITGVNDNDLDNEHLLNGDGLLGIAYDCIIENAKGGRGSDNIKGNSANNKLYGGPGVGVKDTLTGGPGADVFVCSVSDASNNFDVADVITDFQDGTDKIGLEDRKVSDLNSGFVNVTDKDSGKILFLLPIEDGAANFIDSDDFIITDFI